MIFIFFLIFSFYLWLSVMLSVLFSYLGEMPHSAKMLIYFYLSINSSWHHKTNFDMNYCSLNPYYFKKKITCTMKPDLLNILYMTKCPWQMGHAFPRHLLRSRCVTCNPSSDYLSFIKVRSQKRFRRGDIKYICSPNISKLCSYTGLFSRQPISF